MEQHIIDIDPEGNIRILDNGVLSGLKSQGDARTQRVSHVEPIHPALRWMFHLIRRRVSDSSRLAAWTRRWPCRWRANLAPVNGPILGPYRHRQAAIAAEITWLHQNGMGC